MRMSVPRLKKKQYPDDDGRVIAPMNVEGMPWYSQAPALPSSGNQSSLSKRQTRYAIMGALKASLLVGGVLSAGLILFVLFTVHVWLK